MRKLVISLDNENGVKRRDFLKYEYEHVEGCFGSNVLDPYVKEVSEKIKLRYNAKPRTIAGVVGCFASKLKALDYIVNNKIDKVILLEDDSQPVKEKEDYGDEICLLSGQINHPHSWAKDKTWKKEGKNLEIINNFTEGVNEIDYTKYRWTQINALWIPKWEQAECLLEKIRLCKKYIHFDILLANEKLIKKLYYPAPYKHHDYLNKSQVATNPGVIVDYIKV
tara:strand:- start:1879 stop:2547 length:669 start_codon:yes stop_codon:yes gene_type:complete